MIRTLSISLVAAAALLACGGEAPPPATPAAAATKATGAETHDGDAKDKHGHHGKDEHGKLPPAVHEFHETLAPLWHSPQGPDRVTKTCEKAKTLDEKAAATNDKDLADATKALVAECAADGRPQFEAKLKAVHERFHALAEKSH